MSHSVRFCNCLWNLISTVVLVTAVFAVDVGLLLALSHLWFGGQYDMITGCPTQTPLCNQTQRLLIYNGASGSVLCGSAALLLLAEALCAVLTCILWCLYDECRYRWAKLCFRLMTRDIREASETNTELAEITPSAALDGAPVSSFDSDSSSELFADNVANTGRA
jgi:hypothetical protein